MMQDFYNALQRGALLYSLEDGKLHEAMPFKWDDIKTVAFNKEKLAWKIVTKDGQKHYFKLFEKEIRPNVSNRRYEVRIPAVEKQLVALEKIYLFDTKEEALRFIERIKKTYTLPLPDDVVEIEVIDSWHEEIEWDDIDNSNEHLLQKTVA